jgi:glycerol uptake facilitator-like aquaporin
LQHKKGLHKTYKKGCPGGSESKEVDMIRIIFGFGVVLLVIAALNDLGALLDPKVSRILVLDGN